MISNFDCVKHCAIGVLYGVLVIIFIVGVFNCAGFLLAQMGKAMGCAP